MKFHKDGTHPTKTEIFVFGSNLAGRHGSGAAKAANATYGAKYGVGVGYMGRSYAIATKDEHIQTLPLWEVKEHIKQFVEFTKTHPHLSFWVTRVGCVLAGYKDSQIAPLFKGAANCSFAEEWKPYLID